MFLAYFSGLFFRRYILSIPPKYFSDPKMEVLYHIRPYFGGTSPYIALKNRPYIWNRYLRPQSDPGDLPMEDIRPWHCSVPPLRPFHLNEAGQLVSVGS